MRAGELRIGLALRVANDFETLLTDLEGEPDGDAGRGRQRIASIVRAIDLLAQSPLVGRLTRRGNRELITGERGRGYVALYQYFAEDQLVLILAVRSQRDAGYGWRNSSASPSHKQTLVW